MMNMMTIYDNDQIEVKHLAFHCKSQGIATGARPANFASFDVPFIGLCSRPLGSVCASVAWEEHSSVTKWILQTEFVHPFPVDVGYPRGFLYWIFACLGPQKQSDSTMWKD